MGYGHFAGVPSRYSSTWLSLAVSPFRLRNDLLYSLTHAVSPWLGVTHTGNDLGEETAKCLPKTEDSNMNEKNSSKRRVTDYWNLTHLIFYVEQKQIWKRFWWKRILLDEKLQLLEAFCWTLLHVHQSLVVQCHWIEFMLRARWHVGQRYTRRFSCTDIKTSINRTGDFDLWPADTCVQGGPPKRKPPPICQKIVLKIANEIRFLRKVKVWIKQAL